MKPLFRGILLLLLKKLQFWLAVVEGGGVFTEGSSILQWSVGTAGRSVKTVDPGRSNSSGLAV